MAPKINSTYMNPSPKVRSALVWAYNLVLAGVAIFGATRVVALSMFLKAPFHGPWPILGVVVGAAFAELCVVGLPSRASSQTFTLASVALALGLAFVRPVDFLIGQTVGSAIALAVHRHPPKRYCFNLANYAVASEAAILLLPHLATIEADPTSLRLWYAIAASVLISEAFSTVSVGVVRSLAEGRSFHRETIASSPFVVLGAMFCCTMAALAGIASTITPYAALFAAVPVGLIWWTFQKVLEERTKRSNVEFLYETTKVMQQASTLENGLASMLERAREVFRCEYAEVWIRASESDSWFRVEAGRSVLPMEGNIERKSSPPFVPSESGAIIITPESAVGVELLAELGAPSALLARIATADSGGPLGLLLVSHRNQAMPTFKNNDRFLFDLLCHQLALHLENGHLVRSLDELGRLQQQLHHQATHDSLTNLANRALLRESVEKIEGRCAVVVIDLDDFKTINDSLGHNAGDEVLLTVANRLQLAVRPTDTVARFGGDEIVVLLCDVSEGEASLMAERIALTLRASVPAGKTEVALSASLGVAFAASKPALAELLRSADVAMYEAKRRGKGRHVAFTPGMDDEARRRLAMLNCMRSAIDDGQFQLEYQPIVELTTRRVIGAEALLRWNHPDLGLLGPDQFVPLAEESGSIVAIGRWAMERGCADLSALGHLGEGLKLNVNISARQLSDGDLAGDLIRILSDSGVAPESLILEITETTALIDTPELWRTVETLGSLGIKFSLDDFGTGYSSMSALHRLPIAQLKIDKAFTGGETGFHRPLVRTIATVAAQLDLESVAEGVESLAQLEELIGLGCHYGQGFFFARPCGIEEFRTWLGIHRSIEGAGAGAHRSGAATLTNLSFTRTHSTRSTLV